MAKKTVVTVTDDIDGTEGAETVTFSFVGVSYSIDLGKKNRKALEKALEPYIAAGSRVGGPRTTARSSSRSNSAELQKIRDWAKSNGIEVSSRGRIAGAVVDAYNAAN